MTVASLWRNVLLLALCQALSMSMMTVMITVSALVGQMLAADPALATLPLAVQFAAAMAATIPASLAMKRIGRRAGFTLGTLAGAAGGLLAMQAVFAGDFLLYCAANLLIGAAMAFAQFYRFAAADAADERVRGRAISFVLAGGVAAALFGPELAKWSRDLFAPMLFAGSFAAIAVLNLAVVLVLRFVAIPPPSAAERRAVGRPLKTLARQPAFVVAVLSGMLGYGCMNLVMTATPLAMAAVPHAFDETAFVIQWHALGMFAPSFVTGALIARFGVPVILTTGALLVAGCVAINLSGDGIWQFWTALVLLGLGWNFLYVGGSTLLTATYRPAERAKAQALNDFLVLGMVTLTALLSGLLHDRLGWQAVNVAALIPAATILAAIAWLRLQPRARLSA